jgi:hypothetical protein
MSTTLLYLTTSTKEELRKFVVENANRYSDGNFDDLASQSHWRYSTRFTIELGPLQHLSHESGCQAEVENSLAVSQALPDLTPAAAMDGRIWTRLSHVECLQFARSRWLTGVTDETLHKRVRAHFFGATRTEARDDHAIGRLWWNAHIARRLSELMPGFSVRSVLEVLLARADVRLNTIERPGIMARPRLAAAIVRLLHEDRELLGHEQRFREFMKALNARGGGIPFEVDAVSEGAIFSLLRECIPAA